MKFTDFNLTKALKVASTFSTWRDDDPIIGCSNCLKVALNKKLSPEELAQATQFKGIKGLEIEYALLDYYSKGNEIGVLPTNLNKIESNKSIHL